MFDQPQTGSVTDAPSSRLSSLKIGNIEIGFPIVQAALSGYSDLPMRVIARRHGAAYSICEVMLDQFLLALSKRQKTKHFLDIHPDEHPVGGQLMGAEPEQFAAGALKLVDAGFDVIDVNFGCPVKKVLGRCRGGFHLSQPTVALEVLARTRESVPDYIPVTVKMRRGIDDSNESRDKFFTILDGAMAIGLAAATIHGRTVEQRYVGLGDAFWQVFAVNREAVVLAGDFDAVRFQVLHRLIGAAVALMHFRCRAAERAGQQLVA